MSMTKAASMAPDQHANVMCQVVTRGQTNNLKAAIDGVRKFAFLPKVLESGRIAWLRFYYAYPKGMWVQSSYAYSWIRGGLDLYEGPEREITWGRYGYGGSSMLMDNEYKERYLPDNPIRNCEITDCSLYNEHKVITGPEALYILNNLLGAFPIPIKGDGSIDVQRITRIINGTEEE